MKYLKYIGILLLLIGVAVLICYSTIVSAPNYLLWVALGLEVVGLVVYTILNKLFR